MLWRELPRVAAPRRPPTALVLGPMVAFVLVLWLLGHLAMAVVAGVLALLLGQAAVVSRRLGPPIVRVAEGIGHGVGHVLSFLLLGLVYGVLFLPAKVIHGHKELAPPGRGSVEGSQWAERDGPETTDDPGRLFQPDRPVPRRAPIRFALVLVAGLLVLDLGLGLLLHAVGVDGGPSADRASTEARLGALADSPAWPEDEAWAEEYLAELIDKSTDPDSLEFVPFGLVRNGHYEGTHLNTDDWARRSYQQDLPVDADPIRIAFFGGSTMFGEGQRDEHTIPSEVARIAEEQGVAVEVLNYGTQGYVSWQELLLFESVLATEDIDLAVFYDGINDTGIQYDHFSTDPSFYGWPDLEAQLEDASRRATEGPSLGQRAGDLWEAYTETSLTGLLADRLTGDDLDVPEPDGDFTDDERAEAALDLYRRSTRLIRDLGEDAGVETAFFWQPQQEQYSDLVLDGLPEDVTDMSGELDPVADDVYLDGVHTDEQGAALVAEEIWRELDLAQDEPEGG